MTDQQKKAVEEAAEKFAEQDLDTSAWTDHTHDDHCLIWERQNSFQYGAEEVLNNADKYGLVSAYVHDNLASKYKGLVAFYDKHAGTPCEEIRHREEVEGLKEENKRLRTALSNIANTAIDYLTPSTDLIRVTAQEALKGGESCKP